MIHATPKMPKRRNFGSFWRIVNVFARAKGAHSESIHAPRQCIRRNSMVSFKRTKKRNFRSPVIKYLSLSAAGVFALLLILVLVGFSGRNSLRAQLSETQDILAAAIQSDLSDALDSYEGIDRKSANLADDILPTMRRHMYAAHEMNKILVETFGEEYSMLDTAQYESFEAIMKRFDQLIAAGQSTDPAKETLTACMNDLRSSMAGRFTAEGNLLPKTASATTSNQP